jgi:hypothetical protein
VPFGLLKLAISAASNTDGLRQLPFTDPKVELGSAGWESKSNTVEFIS